jgi:hypothetical protein
MFDAAQLPDYPIPVGTRLDGHSWFQFHHAWFRASDFRRRADEAVRAVWLDLIVAAQDEDPVGTLPAEPQALAWLARLPLERWLDLSGREVSPLYGWERCRVSDGRVRLFHPKLLQVTESAARTKLEAAARRASDRERKRLVELREKVLAAGGSQRMADDAAFISRLDDYLTAALPAGKTRTVSRVREAMEARAMQ